MDCFCFLCCETVVVARHAGEQKEFVAWRQCDAQCQVVAHGRVGVDECSSANEKAQLRGICKVSSGHLGNALSKLLEEAGNDGLCRLPADLTSKASLTRSSATNEGHLSLAPSLLHRSSAEHKCRATGTCERGRYVVTGVAYTSHTHPAMGPLLRRTFIWW